jgi:cytoskeletal protein CcmA (bactofilin family)
MFSSKGKSNEPAAVPMTPAPQKRVVRSSAPSIISADLVVSGTLTSTGDIQIDGRVEGDVHSAGLVVGDKAFIQGEVLAEDITVRGRIQGSIRARKVLLCSTCHVEGNILHEAFSVEAGAFFEGNCRHAENPLSEDAGRKQAELKSVPAGAPSVTAVAPAPAPAPMAAPVQMAAAKPVETPRPAATFAPLKTNG